jgi:hypothetical protein
MRARYTMSKEPDDAYFSKFNGTQLQMRDLDSRTNGTPHYCSAPGAPVSNVPLPKGLLLSDCLDFLGFCLRQKGSKRMDR